MPHIKLGEHKDFTILHKNNFCEHILDYEGDKVFIKIISVRTF